MLAPKDADAAVTRLQRRQLALVKRRTHRIQASPVVERMTQSLTKPEDRIKAAVIDRLVDARHVDGDAVLVSEMMVADWSRRADVVLANGHLWGFEVKSEADSLARLPGQLQTFQQHFEKLVVVIAKRFEDAVSKMLPDGVGLWIEEDGAIKQKIAPRCTRLPKQSYLSLMTATEIKDLLSSNGASVKKGTPRLKLCELAGRLPSSDLAGAARNAIKRRHLCRHAKFLEMRTAIGTLDAMPHLRRARTQTIMAEPIRNSTCDLLVPDMPIPLHHPQLIMAPGGPVLKRKTH